MRMRILFVLAAAAGLALSAGPARSQATGAIVGPGDVLQITVYAGGDKQDDFAATVSAQGTITCPLLGEFKLGAMETSGIAASLQAALAKDYYVDPQVLVSVKEHGGMVYLLGEVRRPGAYPLGDASTALSACAMAGGWTDFASPRRAKVTRIEDGKPKLIVVDLLKVRQGKAADLPLQSGDRVEVPRRLF